MTLPGTPLSCDHDEYVRRNVSHVARDRFNASQAGKIARLRTLFGEIGCPTGLLQLQPLVGGDPERDRRGPLPDSVKAPFPLLPVARP